MQEQEDAALAGLLAAAQRGDGAAYAAFLAAVTPMLRRFARARLTKGTDLEDFVQDTLLSLHQARATYRPDQPVGPWLHAIARHRLADLLRRRYRRGAVEAPYDQEQAEQVAQEETPLRQDLGPLLARLPDGQRQALELVKLQELSLQEASARSGVSVGALKVAVHRGIAGIRSMLLTGKDVSNG